MSKIQSINPYNWELNWEVELFTSEQVDTIIDTAHNAYLEWKDTTFDERKVLFHKFADELEKDIDECARLQTIEMWMLYSDSKAWLQVTADLIRWFADNTEDILWDKRFETSQWFTWTEKYDSLWVIFGIAPWNFPFNQLLRAAVPNILAWNTQLYKHASNVPLCAWKIQELFDKAGFKKWIYSNLYVSSSLSEHIISNKKVAGINLTWGERAWSAVWSLAGKYIKPSVLELWWNDAFVVCDTNNLDSIVEKAVMWRLRNGGQACNGSKRFIVLEKHYDEFCEKFTKKMESKIMWDPLDSSTQVQPLANLSAIKEVESQVQKAIETWAKLLTGGKRKTENSCFYLPTVLADVTPDVSSFHEEIFGPVASVIKSRDLEHSIELANNSDFWLSAVVFWDNKEQITKVAHRLTWGIIYLNQTASSKASIPFWWVKKSWIWKENWPEWLKAFTNKKVIMD